MPESESRTDREREEDRAERYNLAHRLDVALTEREELREALRALVEWDDASETYEAGCNCLDQTAGYVCGDPGPCGWNRHIPTYDMAWAVRGEPLFEKARSVLSSRETTDSPTWKPGSPHFPTNSEGLA